MGGELLFIVLVVAMFAAVLCLYWLGMFRGRRRQNGEPKELPNGWALRRLKRTPKDLRPLYKEPLPRRVYMAEPTRYLSIAIDFPDASEAIVYREERGRIISGRLHAQEPRVSIPLHKSLHAYLVRQTEAHPDWDVVYRFDGASAVITIRGALGLENDLFGRLCREIGALQ